MSNVECVKCGMYQMWNVSNVECVKCGMRQMWNVSNVECQCGNQCTFCSTCNVFQSRIYLLSNLTKKSRSDKDIKLGCFDTLIITKTEADLTAHTDPLLLLLLISYIYHNILYISPYIYQLNDSCRRLLFSF